MTSKILRVQQSFSKACHTYDEHADIQRQAAKQLMEQLPENPSSILDVGCGTGILTQLLISTYPEALTTALDMSSNMIQMSKTKTDPHPVTYVKSTIESFKSNIAFDLVVSNATFHWVSDLDTLLRKCFDLE